MRFYHAMELSSVSFGPIRADRRFSDPDFLPAYDWLAKKIGFFPLFLAAGTKMAVDVTGYRNQWRVFIGQDSAADGSSVRRYQRQGEFPNYVLMVFEPEALPSVVFIDNDGWSRALNDATNDKIVTPSILRYLFKPSWSRERWLKHARRNPVQVLTPGFDMRLVSEVWVRNKPTKRKLELMGFSNVLVRRCSVPER